MPGSMNGIKLAAAVRDPWPPIKIVATSGRVKLGVDDLPKGGAYCGLGASPCNFVKEDPAGMTRDR